jgi:hypothetical protein
MARKRRDEDQVPEDPQAGKKSKRGRAAPEPELNGAGQEPELDESGQASGSRRGRKLVLLLALAGAATWLVRRNQRKAELDEGIWHEAPAPATTAPAPAGPAPTA